MFVTYIVSICSLAALNVPPSLCLVPGREREAHSQNPSSRLKKTHVTISICILGLPPAVLVMKSFMQLHFYSYAYDSYERLFIFSQLDLKKSRIVSQIPNMLSKYIIFGENAEYSHNLTKIIHPIILFRVK